VSEDWELQNKVLETFNFNTDHTGQHIANELARVITDWGSPIISCCVTDNATLNLVVQEAIKADEVLSKLKDKCKEIVSHFHRSPKSSEKLGAVQK
jgi:hypothetical protein